MALIPLKNAMPTGIVATAIFCLIFSWNEYAFAVLLTSGTARAYADAVDRTTKSAQRLTEATQAPARCGLPALFEVTAAQWLANPALAEEMFGPAAILVRTASAEDTVAVARSFEGQLTVTLQLDPGTPTRRGP